MTSSDSDLELLWHTLKSTLFFPFALKDETMVILTKKKMKEQTND